MGLKTVKVRNGRWLYAKLGQKVEPTRRSLAMLPAASDLPGDGWTLLDEATWRTGRLGKATEWGIRARALGSVTAIRSFEQKTESRRGLWAEVMPLASEDDAAEALNDLPNRFVRNPRSKVTFTTEHQASGVMVPGTASTWAYERNGTSAAGDSAERIVAGTVGRIQFVVDVSGLGEAWPWDEVVSIAGDLVHRISQSVD
jgi:hypothetical protein